MGVVTDLQPIATFIVTADLGTVDERGTWTSGVQTSLTKCHIELGNDRVVDFNGNEVVTRGSVFVLEDAGLYAGVVEDGSDRKEYRYTLPSDWPDPRTNLRAVNVLRNEDDEAEVYYEIIL